MGPQAGFEGPGTPVPTNSHPGTAHAASFCPRASLRVRNSCARLPQLSRAPLVSRARTCVGVCPRMLLCAAPLPELACMPRRPWTFTPAPHFHARPRLHHKCNSRSGWFPNMFVVWFVDSACAMFEPNKIWMLRWWCWAVKGASMFDWMASSQIPGQTKKFRALWWRFLIDYLHIRFWKHWVLCKLTPSGTTTSWVGNNMFWGRAFAASARCDYPVLGIFFGDGWRAGNLKKSAVWACSVAPSKASVSEVNQPHPAAWPSFADN